MPRAYYALDALVGVKVNPTICNETQPGIHDKLDYCLDRRHFPSAVHFCFLTDGYDVHQDKFTRQWL